MSWLGRKPMRVFARAASLRRRVAYSLAIVRLILVPVIFLAIYYLIAMGRIVDRIVSVDAPVATMAERASVEMVEARRNERSYFLDHDPSALEANRQALSRLEQLIATCRDLQPEERTAADRILQDTKLYEQRLREAVVRMGEPSRVPTGRIRAVVKVYEADLDNLLRRSRRQSRAQLMEALHERLGSLDAEITTTLEAEDPALRQITVELRTPAAEVLQRLGDLEKRSWDRVEREHQKTRELIRGAEWVLGIVSALTLLVSIAISFVLPRQVVKPLLDLKAAVDHAAAGNYEVEFDVKGQGEVSQLARSVRNLIAHVREKKTNSAATPP
jgi:CHASE3 domain sensor protein